MVTPAKHNGLATKPFRQIKISSWKVNLCLTDKKRIIVHSDDRSFRVWDLETGTQVGEEWEDKDGVMTIALSPDGKKVASGGFDSAVKLWSVDTGKVIKTWTGHTDWVNSVYWSLDGGRVVSVSRDKTFRVWNVESGKTDAKMIATGLGSNGLKIWNANSGELLKTFKGVFSCLAWTSDGKTLVAERSKFDTATWTEVELRTNYVNAISVFPNDRILAITSYPEKTAQLWDLKKNQPIGKPLYHQENVYSATFSVDGKLLVTHCLNDHIYTWDVSAIVKEAGLPSDILDVTLRPAPKIKGARVPPGFFDDALREANSRIRISQSHAPPTQAPQQRTLSPFTSVWRRSKPYGATEPTTQSLSRPFSWTQNLSSILRRRDRSDIQLQEVEVPYTAGQPMGFSLLFSFATKYFLHRGTITGERERNQLLARLDPPILIPRRHRAHYSRAHRHHLQLLIRRQYLQSLVPQEQWEHLHLITLLLYGALVLCAGFAVRLFSTPTVNIRDAVATTSLASRTTLRYNTRRMLDWFLTLDRLRVR